RRPAAPGRPEQRLGAIFDAERDLALINGIGWAALAHSGGAGVNAEGSGVPTWGESTSTMSARMGLRLFRSSSCSAFPTLKASRVATKSSMKASHSPLVTPMLVCDCLMLSPV